MKFVCQSKRRNNLRAACDGIFSFLSGRGEGKKRKNFVDWTKWPRYEKEACVTARALVWYKHIHFSWSRAEDGPRRAHARDRAIVMTFSRIVAFLFLLPPYMCTGLSLSPLRRGSLLPRSVERGGIPLPLWLVCVMHWFVCSFISPLDSFISFVFFSFLFLVPFVFAAPKSSLPFAGNLPCPLQFARVRSVWTARRSMSKCE